MNKCNGSVSPELHTKVHGYQSTGSKKEDFKVVFLPYTVNSRWVWKPAGHVTNIILTYFHFLLPIGLHTKFIQRRSNGF